MSKSYPLPILLILGVQVLKIFEIVFFARIQFTQGNTMMGYAAGIILLVTALAIYGIFNLRPWGRHLQILLSSIGLFPFSLSTAVNGLILIYLISDQGKALFYPQPLQQEIPKED